MTTDDLINTDQRWLEIDPNQRMQGRNSARQVKNSSNEVAFFKTPPPHVLANEVLAYVIADKLNLPCAVVKFAKLFESGGSPQIGVLSFRVTGFEPIEWPLVPAEIRAKPKKYIMNLNDLAKIAIFDIWCYNTDRSTANLIISRKEEWPGKFTVYMIDHEESLYGSAEPCNRHEGDGAWQDITRFLNVPELKETVKFSEVLDFINEIEGVSDEELKSMMALIPNEYYNPNQAEIVFNILQKRRNSLRAIVEDWCRSENKL